MKPTEQNVNELLKVELANEVLEIDAVRKCYNYFLGTQLSAQYPELVEMVEQNRHIATFHRNENMLKLQSLNPSLAKKSNEVPELHLRLQEMRDRLFSGKHHFTVIR